MYFEPQFKMNDHRGKGEIFLFFFVFSWTQKADFFQEP